MQEGEEGRNGDGQSGQVGELKDPAAIILGVDITTSTTGYARTITSARLRKLQPAKRVPLLKSCFETSIPLPAVTGPLKEVSPPPLRQHPQPLCPRIQTNMYDRRHLWR